MVAKYIFKDFWVAHWQDNSCFSGNVNLFCEKEWLTSVNFRTEGKVDESICMFTKFDKKRAIKLKFPLKMFVDMSDTWDALLMYSVFNSFTTSSGVAGLKENDFYNILRQFWY